MIGRNRGRRLRAESASGAASIAAVLSLLLLLPAVTFAQDAPPPTGPAQIIGGAARDRASRELNEAAQRGSQPAPTAETPLSGNGHIDAPSNEPASPPPVDLQPQAAVPAGHGAMPGENEPPPIANESPDPSLPTGTVQVRVIDPQGRPAASALVSLGVMESDGGRSSKDTKASADGVATFDKLPGGEKQAYRVNVPYKGAKYSSNPFRLPPRGGYRVEIRQLPVTTDSRLVVLYLGATSLELKDDRIKVVQQVKLLNLGGATYVFPEKGTLVPFPKGFLAVQTEQVMTDQHVAESKDEGVRVKGSLPPGDATLLWGFDLPLTGTEAHFTIGLPWLTFAYRVISDAPPGMTLAVDGFPEPILHDEDGRRLLLTEVQLKVGDKRLEQLHINLRGIPGPGPARWIAGAAAFLLLIGGVVFARRPDGRGARNERRTRSAEIEERKAELLARARELQEQRSKEEIGPQYHAQQLELVRDELAALLLASGDGKSEPKPSAS
jgi:hypothetical protein